MKKEVPRCKQCHKVLEDCGCAEYQGSYTPDDDVEAEHGAESCYSNGPGGFMPTLSCICGQFSAREDTWEEAGREFDGHMAAVNLRS